ncbi:MAG: PilN domain-containing protein [Paracoccaceae bacterium]
MTDQTGGVNFERQGLSIGPWFTYARALLAQGAARATTTDILRHDRCLFFIEMNGDVPLVCARGVEDAIELDDSTYKVLADAAQSGMVDLVLAHDSSIDLNFEVPPGLLPEVSQMIEAEINYRSPFAEGVAMSFWEAHEAESGGWSVTAALTMEAPLMEIVGKLREHGVEIASVIREHEFGDLRTLPPWIESDATQAATPWALFKSLSPTLQATLAGAALFALSATAHWGQTVLTDWSLSDDAARAQVELRSTAAASSRLRNLDASLAKSTEVLAVTGTLSEVLPDEVWLSQIIIDDNEVTLVGFAPSAAEVTRILSDVPNLTDIKFASPVIRDNSQEIERFRIAATFADGVAQ